MISFRSIATTLLVASSFGLAACETTTMSAKSGPESVVQNSKASACERKQNQRSECDDQVGCFFDNETGHCSAH